MSGAWHYVHTSGVTPAALGERAGWTTPQDGRIAGDDALLQLWRDSDMRRSGPQDAVTCAAMACLAEAGLLTRRGIDVSQPPRPSVPTTGPTVSVVLVTYSSEAWIDDCIRSLREQTYTSEVIVVDNGSPVDPEAAVRKAHPDAVYLRLSPGRSFAAALNAGAAVAGGGHLLFLNPDVALEPDALAQMVARLTTGPRIGAVAAKLRFHWAPAFLNGIGNRVTAHSWGSDNGIGHLDLGQFDDRRTVPSACFAAALVPRDAWLEVGPVDEGFPMYYEDVAWCYRARRLGWEIAAAPDAVVYHAFGSRLATADADQLPARKLAHVVYGRQRFAATVLNGAARREFRRSYAREDLANFRHHRRAGNRDLAAAYRRAWWQIVRDAPSWRRSARGLDGRATRTTDEMLRPDAPWPPALVWNGVPELTMPIVRDVYLPLFEARRTRPLPEFA